MNKKVLTLCAGFLLAGSMYASAQYVQINPANLVDGEYILATADGDSIVTFMSGSTSSATSPWDDIKFTGKAISEAGATETIRFEKSESGNTWTLSYDGKVIYVNSDGKAYTGPGTQEITVATVSRTNNTASLRTSTAGTVSNGTPTANMYLMRGEDADSTMYGYSSRRGNAAGVFTLFAVPAEAPEGETIAAIDEQTQTFLLIVDNEYVGATAAIPTATRAAAASDITLSSSIESETGYVWMQERDEENNISYKNIATNQYLSVNTDGELTLSDEPVTVTTDGNALLVNGEVVGASVVVESSTPMPTNVPFDVAESDATEITLYASNGKVIAADGSLVDYNADDATTTVWSLTAVPVGTAVGDNQQYEVRLSNAEVENNDDHYLVVDGNIVTVEGVSVDPDGEITLPADGGIVLKAGDKFVTINANGDGLTAIEKGGQTMEFGAGEINIAKVYVKDLLQRFGEYFTVNITYLPDTDNETDLTSIFAGSLTPYNYINYDGGDIDKNLSEPYDTEFMLMNGDGKILAVNTDPDARLSEGSTNHVYPLTLIDPNELMNDIKDGGDHYYKVWFSIEYTPGQDATTTGAFTVDNILVNIGDGTEPDWQTIGCYLDKTVPTLVAADKVNLKDVRIRLNASSVVSASSWLNKPAYYTVEVANTDKDAEHYGLVLGLDANGYIDYVDPAKTNIELPEGQFAIEYVDEDADGKALENPYYKFTNRETGNAITDYYYNTPVEFTLNASSLYSVGSDGTTFAYRHGGHMDTLSIKPVTNYTSEDGFKRFTAAELNANTYNVSMPILNGPLYVIENHNDRHRIGLDAEEATDWRIEMSTVRMMDAANDLVRVVQDTVSVLTTIKYWVDNDWHETQVTNPKGKYYYTNTELQIPTYIFKNTATNEYLNGKDFKEETGNAYYVCNEDERTATRVALKIVGDSTVNLIPVNGQSVWNKEAKVTTTDWIPGIEIKESDYDDYAEALDLRGQKIIGGTTAATGVLHDVNRFQATDNDLFVIESSDARTYALLEEGENIILMREENNDEVVYEDSLFAGIDNRLAYTDINPTLYVDTAYVNRVGNYKYEYLLVVQPNRSNEWYCPYNDEHNTATWREENGVDHCADAVRVDRLDGRFLVNMRDSADANEDVHNNKFEYEGESKLAFVPGYHQNDTLYLTNEAGEVIAKSEVGNSAPHYAKFAFKMMNENEFVVEVGEGYTEQVTWTRRGNNWVRETSKGEPTTGYLRWHNGYLVVTDKLDQAERFMMEASEQNATANESIEDAANSAVSVTATDGAVVIKGAEGKNVVIATILGKVVANETINSDNETIAVPAGIAVVSVDGESFKVVVK